MKITISEPKTGRDNDIKISPAVFKFIGEKAVIKTDAISGYNLTIEISKEFLSEINGLFAARHNGRL